MNILCPFFKDKCLGNECVMWKNEKCLVVSFMENVITPPSEEFQMPETVDFGVTGIREVEVPDEIKSATPEELAVELVAFAKKEFPDDENVRIYSISQMFWASKNVTRYGVPPEVQYKIQKAEMLAQKELEKEREIQEKERIEKEKEELPSLVGSCTDWAKEHGLKRVTKADVDAFLMEKNIEITPQTQRSLYAMTNVALRSKFQ